MGLLLNSQKRSDVGWYVDVIHVCGTFQKMFLLFLFYIAFLNSLAQEEYTAQNNEKSMLGRMIFCAKVWLFSGFFQNVDKTTCNDAVTMTWRTCGKSHINLHFQLSKKHCPNFIFIKVHMKTVWEAIENWNEPTFLPILLMGEFDCIKVFEI